MYYFSISRFHKIHLEEYILTTKILESKWKKELIYKWSLVVINHELARFYHRHRSIIVGKEIY